MVVKYCNNSAVVTFPVTDEGTSPLGLDAIQALGIDIHGSSLSCQQVTETPDVPKIKSSSLPQIASAEFAHLFSGQLGLVKGFIHDIHLGPFVQPVSAKIRLLPLVLREQVSVELHRLESAIIKRVSVSEWISPLVVVRKKDNTMGLCVDLREPNKVIVVNAFPLPRTDELLHRLADANVFSKFSRLAVFEYLAIYRFMPHITTGLSTAMLLHSRQPWTRLDVANMPHIYPEFASPKLREEVQKCVLQTRKMSERT